MATEENPPKTVKEIKIQNLPVFPVTQIKGQLIIGPPSSWELPPPDRGCEIYVAGLPRDYPVPDLFKLFATVYSIYKVRIMLDFSGNNRGFCFVVYANPFLARQAVKQFNGFYLGTTRIFATISYDNCQLYMSRIPRSLSPEEIAAEITRIFRGVVNVKVPSNTDDPSLNKGYAIVTFDCHNTAVETRKLCWPFRLLLWASHLYVDWAIPKQQMRKNWNHKVEVNVSPSMSSVAIRRWINKLLDQHNEKPLNTLVHESGATVYFRRKDAAKRAQKILSGIEVNGYKWNAYCA